MLIVGGSFGDDDDGTESSVCLDVRWLLMTIRRLHGRSALRRSCDSCSAAPNDLGSHNRKRGLIYCVNSLIAVGKRENFSLHTFHLKTAVALGLGDSSALEQLHRVSRSSTCLTSQSRNDNSNLKCILSFEISSPRLTTLVSQ
jgi:hypothetical protein